MQCWGAGGSYSRVRDAADAMIRQLISCSDKHRQPRGISAHLTDGAAERNTAVRAAGAKSSAALVAATSLTVTEHHPTHKHNACVGDLSVSLQVASGGACTRKDGEATLHGNTDGQ
jgi:mevalonate pyrophosphate decarboxylase